MRSRAMVELAAAYAFIERQFLLLKRYWLWEMVWIVYSLCMTLSIGFLGKGVGAMLTNGSALDTNELILFLLTGSLLWGFLSELFWNVSNVMSWERWEGTIEYTFMAPVRRVTHLVGMCGFAIIYATIRTALMLGIVTLFFHLDLGGANLLGALGVLAVSSFSFVGLGMMAAVLPLLSQEKGSQITGIIEGVMLMVSGVYYSVAILPGWLRGASYLSPAMYTLRDMRYALGVGEPVNLAPDMLILALMGAIMIPLGLWIFQLGEQHCKKTGKLKRAG
jgi:ABC-2 type transport system permease protein